MKKNKKTLSALRAVSIAAVIALSAGILGGCSEKSGAKDENGRTVISVGGWPSKEGTELDNYNARKERFEADNPDVVVNPDLWSFARNTFYAKAAGGQLPTVYGVAYTELPEIINSKYSADLTDVLNRRGYEGKFNRAVLDIVSKDGRIYALPNNAYILGMGVNTKLFEAAGLMEEDGTPKQPKDWYELAEFAVKIKEATGKSGFIFPTANNYGGWMFSCLAWSFGVDFMEKDADGKWKATFNTPEAAEALQYIKDLKWKYDVLPSNTLVDGTEYYKVFAVGNAGMLMAAGDLPRSVFQYGMSNDDIGMIMKHEFSARPVYLSRDDRITAHFTTCFLALTIYRYLEKRIGHGYTCNELIEQLKAMKFYKTKEGYIPVYTRTDLTDTLHERFGFRTDYQLITHSEMKRIIKATKKKTHTTKL